MLEKSIPPRLLFVKNKKPTFIKKEINSSNDLGIDLNIIKFNKEFTDAKTLAQKLNDAGIKKNKEVPDIMFEDSNVCGILSLVVVNFLRGKGWSEGLINCKNLSQSWDIQKCCFDNYENIEEDYKAFNSNCRMFDESFKKELNNKINQPQKVFYLINKPKSFIDKLDEIFKVIPNNTLTLLQANNHYFWVINLKNKKIFLDSKANNGCMATLIEKSAKNDLQFSNEYKEASLVMVNCCSLPINQW